MVDAGVAFVQTDRLHHQVLHTQGDQLPVQHVAERPGLVATVDRLRLGELGLDPLAEFGRRELLRGLRRAVVQDPDHDDGVGMDVQSQFDGLRFDIRDLLHANFGGIGFLFNHSVGRCSALALACQLLMSSPKPSDAQRDLCRAKRLGVRARQRRFGCGNTRRN